MAHGFGHQAGSADLAPHAVNTSHIIDSDSYYEELHLSGTAIVIPDVEGQKGGQGFLPLVTMADVDLSGKPTFSTVTIDSVSSLDTHPSHPALASLTSRRCDFGLISECIADGA